MKPIFLERQSGKVDIVLVSWKTSRAMLSRVLERSNKTNFSSIGNSRGKRVWEVPGTLGGYEITAFPDSGSGRDILSHTFVKKKGWSDLVDYESTEIIDLPDGKSLRSVGKIELPFQFRDERNSYSCLFTVLPQCVHDVILGGSFLKFTQTLTRFCHRIKERFVQLVGPKRLRLLGSPDSQILGQFNGHLTSAFPDTGSDLMLVSRNFAERRRLNIRTKPSDLIGVEFADGSSSRTAGVVTDVSWSFGYGSNERATFRSDFYVLDDLCCDIILSNEFLFDTDAYSTFERFFVSFAEDDEESDSLYLIQRLDEPAMAPINSNAGARQATIGNIEEEENCRRAEEAERISRLPESERITAQQTEDQRNALWDLDHPYSPSTPSTKFISTRPESQATPPPQGARLSRWHLSALSRYRRIFGKPRKKVRTQHS